jgi:hypothetical protein
MEQLPTTRSQGEQMKLYTSIHQNNLYRTVALFVSFLPFILIGCHMRPKISGTQSALTGIQTQLTNIDKDHWKITMILPVYDNDDWNAKLISEQVDLYSSSANKGQTLSWELSRERWKKNRPFEVDIKNRSYSGRIVVSIGGTLGNTPDTLLTVAGHVIMR